jgi:hypothetical protein
MKYGIVVALTAVVVAAACSGGDSYHPMSPDGISSANNESYARSGSVHIEKDCTNYFGRAQDTCTITKSNLKEIGVGTVIHYLQQANQDFTLSSDVVIDPPGPGNNVVFGHCALSLVSGIGICGLSGGTGKFTFFHATVDVSPAGGKLFDWDGTYSYGQ